jgi:hypothetical protein
LWCPPPSRHSTLCWSASETVPVSPTHRGGALVPGERVENEIALAERLRVSRPTARRAFQELVDLGMLMRKRGVGTTVAPVRVRRRVDLTNLFDDLTVGVHAYHDRVEYSVGPGTPEVSDMLEIRRDLRMDYQGPRRPGRHRRTVHLDDRRRGWQPDRPRRRRHPCCTPPSSASGSRETWHPNLNLHGTGLDDRGPPVQPGQPGQDRHRCHVADSRKHPDPHRGDRRTRRPRVLPGKFQHRRRPPRHPLRQGCRHPRPRSKGEFYYRRVWPTKKAVRIEVGKWIEDRHNQRRHASIGQITPVVFELQYSRQIADSQSR